MAWFAEYKRCLCYKQHKYYHWIKWYKKYLYNIWFDSLPTEEQERIIREKEKSLLYAKYTLSFLSRVAEVYGYSSKF